MELFLVLLLAAAQVIQGQRHFPTCTLHGETFPHSPSTPVEGESHTCFCDEGKWTGCRPNPPHVPSPHVPFTPHQQTALAARQKFSFRDFVFNLKGQSPDSNGEGGEIRAASLTDFKALTGQGITYTLFQLDPCGINLPHVHPRATELIYVISGRSLRTAFVEENGGRTIVNDISQGHITFFPQGLIHYQQNLGCDPVEFISALNSEDPGVVTIPSRLFTLPDEALQASFDLDGARIDSIRRGLPAGPARGRFECLRHCRH